jgi:hypothetical protein
MTRDKGRTSARAIEKDFPMHGLSKRGYLTSNKLGIVGTNDLWSTA